MGSSNSKIKGNEDEFPVSKSVLQKWNHILTKGPTEPGVHFDCNVNNLRSKPWFSKEELKKCQEVVRANRLHLRVTTIPGIVMMLQLPVFLTTLLHTKRSESMPLLFYRYLDTALEVNNWLDYDLLDEDSEGFKAIQRVREKHLHATKLMEKVMVPDETFKQNPKAVWFSQYTMIINQWAFFALFLMYPKECGLHESQMKTDKVLKSVNYFWRCLGFMLGIKDEYNIAQENYKETIQLGHLMLREVLLPVVTAPHTEDNPGFYMGLDVLKAMAPMLPPIIVSGEATLNYWYDIFKIPKEHRVKMLLMDQIRLVLFSFGLKYVIRIAGFSWIVDAAIEIQLLHSKKNRSKIYKEFEKNFPGVKYTLTDFNASKCPFSQYLLPLTSTNGQCHKNNNK